MDLRERIEKAKADRDAALALISDDDRAEQEQRDELSRIENEKREALTEKRDLDLARRLEKAQNEHADWAFRSVAIKDWPDTFIVKRSGSAHAAWIRGITAQASGGKMPDRVDAARKYAVATIYDWNGVSDFDTNPESTRALVKYLTDNPGIVTPLTDAASSLAGINADEKKGG